MTHHDRKLTVLHREYGRKNAGEDSPERVFTNVAHEMKRFAGEARDRIAGNEARLDEIEQKLARRGNPAFGGAPVKKSLGALVAEHPEVQEVIKKGPAWRGKLQISIDAKSITSAPATVGPGVSPSNSLVQADRQDIVALPQRRLFVRDLFVPASTQSSNIEYPVESAFTNAAATVAEGVTKPYSNVTFDLKSAPVRTIAHMLKASRQIMDDSPALAGFLDSQMRYGLAIVEEAQILFGDGTGQNLLGLVPQATPFAAPFAITAPTQLDTILQGISQAENALYDATGVVINSTDWRRMQSIKDAGGNYIGSGPFADQPDDRIWTLPKVATPLMPQGRFLVGAFATAAQVFERMSVEVLISTENADDFERNLISMRCEERVAFAVYRPGSVVTGTYPN